MTPARLRVVLVDDHEMFREGMVSILRTDPALTVVGQGATSGAAVELTVDLHPDVLILDVELGGAPASTTICTIRRRSPATRIVVLSMHRDSVLRRELLRAGAAEYVTKSVPAEDLLAAIHRTTTAGDNAPADAATSLLSERQHQVLLLMAEAKSNRAIAVELGITEGTVKRHANDLYCRLQASSRMDAVRRARLLGILD